jgi:hypothetical protein
MEQRSVEYAKQRRDMCFELQSINREALQLAQAYEDAERFSVTVDPWAALRTMVEVDSERELSLVELLKKQTVYEHSHKATLRRVILAKRDLAEAVNKAADETAHDLAEALHEWDSQRVQLEKRIAHKEKAFDEVAHHLHRGTNFLWTSQLQRADLRPLRELKLACDQHRAKLAALTEEVAQFNRAVRDEETNIKREVEEVDSKLNDTVEYERKLRERNAQLRQEYVDVQAQYPMLVAPPLLAGGNPTTAATGASSPGGRHGSNSPQRGIVVTKQQQQSRSPVRGVSPPGGNKRSQPRRSASEESWHGPSFMKPTANRRQMDSKSAVQRDEQKQRVSEFRSRKPGQALSKAQKDRPQFDEQ